VETEAIDTTKLMAEILTAGCDDYWGLYEIIRGLNTAHPNVKQEVSVAAVQVAMSKLLACGFVQLYKGKTCDPVPEGQCDGIIQDPGSWEPPAQQGPGSYISFATTKAGEAAYHAGNFDVS